ncbi:uncharacterized protein K452DRAFT_348667 [Aplosporella prunicola CBS 121167]|uniref:Uncharacterized protein n=1 Tax=Aplosporella prunicola CBS 121167 TaxID=1176127 RepID=A0A6A6BRD3_9PEZI|nr:uncharacterized protein K452DRAFT_348667 [Aplosporella prunicola CBS 121167]KAF2146013.1 hypothetical protein K452DRAFT_348667 [Aplosporella prunicola CBS 121167]
MLSAMTQPLTTTPSCSCRPPDAFGARYEDIMNGDLDHWGPRYGSPAAQWAAPHYAPPTAVDRARTQPPAKRNFSDPTSLMNPDEWALPVRHKQNGSLPYATPSLPPEGSVDSFEGEKEWPPDDYTLDSAMDLAEAEDIVCAGASTFKGFLDDAPAAPPGHYRFYAVMENEHSGRNDRCLHQHEAFKDSSLTLTGPADSAYPWVALEQPCMAYCFGRRPGTTTLNYRVSKSGSIQPTLKYGAEVKPRKIKLLHILDRLRDLERGFEDDAPEELYIYLYNNLLDDPDMNDEPHIGIERQMTDLIIILTSPDWVDFSQPKNQVVAKFFETNDHVRKQNFFHQLLLSVELYLRVHLDIHGEKAKRQLLQKLPPKVLWDLAVAQKWLENMSIMKSRTSSNQSVFSFELRKKKRQKEALKVFAQVLKWPNLAEVNYILEEKSRYEKAVEDRSADAMSWFTGVVLPGPTLPWLLMNSLIDCDKDTGPSLKYLTHVVPSSGFQYKANTYWSHRCIVGKVLGASKGVNQVAGWIGPCNYSPDLKRTECVKIRQIKTPGYKLTALDVETMKERTHPLGPEEADYPVNDYELLVPDMEDVTNDIRVEKLSFAPVKDQQPSKHGSEAPLLFDAAIVFACGGDSWPMRLKYDVDFISAYPCQGGPHVLFFDYRYKSIRVDDGLVDIHEWGPRPPRQSSSNRSSPTSSRTLSQTSIAADAAHAHIDRVLAIEALGVSDNEVFARAWCAHNGHSAVVANIKETCMACAIREAYAACVSVVIVTEGGVPGERDED